MRFSQSLRRFGLFAIGIAVVQHMGKSGSFLLENSMKSRFAGFGSSAAVVSLLGAGLFITGCHGGGSQPQSAADAPASAPAEHVETAPEAWDRLQSQANSGRMIGMFGGPRIVSNLLQDKLAQADEQVNEAMQSPLPAEALDSMVDDVAAKMAAALPEVPEVKKSDTKVVLAFSNIADASNTGNPELSQALDSLRSKLSQSEKMNNNFIFVSTTEGDANRLSSMIAGSDTSAFRDPLQRTPDTTHAVSYDPSKVFLISGKIYTIKQPMKHSVQVKLYLTFTHVQSRRIVLSPDPTFIRTYMWNPNDPGKWELQP
jgi:hypothetical protein